ncbi:glycosyltransferase [Providencia rettgeri]|uniref:glycosyltransferase n=1 Tax=Providencia sp. PROV247 TaxID=2949938 RepID=UPI00234B61B3|nr:glycosyltransferase [Providencia sp. PROV247]
MFKFSVLLSVYRNENPTFLETALSSILTNQTRLPNEVILIKDGPLTNELDEIINHWEDSHPTTLKVISLEKNVGLGNALNIGISYCKYNWIFRMDTDDYCLPDRFKQQIQYIQSNPEIALLGTCTEEFDSNMSTSLGLRKVPNSHSDILLYVKRRNPFNHMTVAFRKDVILSVGGYQHHLYMEDYNLWIRVIAAGYQVGNIDEVLVNVRGGDSMVKRRKGFVYINSELQLAKLKVEKNIDSKLHASLIFILRSIPRILPTFLLSKIYRKTRS